MNERRVGRNHIWPVKAMTDQEYCSCLQGCYRPAPELQTDMRNFLPCCQFQARNRGRIRKCQGGRSFIHGQQTQTGLPTQRGQWSTVGAATFIPSPQKYTLNTASRANANTSRWISNQMIPSPGCSRQSLQHYEADLPGAGNGTTVLPLLDCLLYRTAPKAGHSTLATAKLVSIATVNIFLPRSLRKWEKKDTLTTQGAEEMVDA